MVKRIYTERRSISAAVTAAIKEALVMDVNVRVLMRYDVQGITDEQLAAAVPVAFCTPATDDVYLENLPELQGEVFAVEYLPERSDARADTASDCVRLLLKCDRPTVRCATVYAVVATEKQLAAIKSYLVNPSESRFASLDKPTTLERKITPPEPVRMVDGFFDMSDFSLGAFYREHGFLMSLDDLRFVQSYFRSTRRNPTYIELKVIDSYWSGDCARVTLDTALATKIKSDNPHIQAAYADYVELFNGLYDGRADKYPSLTDVATIGVKELRKNGHAPFVDISHEANACAITQDVVMRDGTVEPWYILFKNETADTCSCGGEVRAILADRAVAYQAMRVSGSAELSSHVRKTDGPSPRAKARRAASERSAYCYGVGVATGEAREYYHPGYGAKRLETGFAVGAAPRDNIVRSVPRTGDIVVLIGGGQTDNGETRKLGRLMLDGELTRLIKRCVRLDGGVATSLGTLASGLDIELASLPCENGVSASALAVWQSRERLAAVVAPDDLDKLTEKCNGENADVTAVAKVTDNDRLRMYLNGNLIVDLERRFLDSNGVRREATALIKDPAVKYFGSLSSARSSMLHKCDYTALLCDILADGNVCSQKGLTEAFDSTVGGNSVLMPLGGKYRLTPSSVTAAKLPADTDVCTVCSHGLSAVMPESPYIGGMYSVILAVEKLAAAGVRLDHIYLSLHEFFARCTDQEKWGAPMSALLGALTAQLNLKRAAIGNTADMTGTSEKAVVPPTLVAFGLGVADSAVIIDNSFKTSGERVFRYRLKRDEYGVPDFDNLCDFLMLLAGEIGRSNVTAAAVVERGGAAATVVKSCFGNGLGFAFVKNTRDMFEESEGDIIFSARTGNDFYGYDLDFLGITTDEASFLVGASISKTLDGTDVAYDGKAVDGKRLLSSFTGTLEAAYPTTAQTDGTAYNVDHTGKGAARPRAKSKPKKIKVFIPVFPGTTGEAETARAFKNAGAEPVTFVVNNRNANDVDQCVKAMAKAIDSCKILALPGGTAESARLIAALLSDPAIAESVEKLLYKRDGLALGMGSGFNALVRLGLLPDGHMRIPQKTDPFLTLNSVGKRVCTLAEVRVCSNFSPWLCNVNVGDTYQVPVSHDEGRFVADKTVLDKLIEGGQIATQYCDFDGNATTLGPFDPYGSMLAIEGIVSPDGRVLGRSGHSARTGEFLLKNAVECYAKANMRIFEAGVKYFK